MAVVGMGHKSFFRGVLLEMVKQQIQQIRLLYISISGLVRTPVSASIPNNTMAFAYTVDSRGNVFFVIRSHNLGLPPPPIMCIRWFSSLLSVSLVLMLNLELLLLARVYAMYRHCLSLVIVFGILLAAKIPVTIFLVVIACRKVLFMGATCIVQSIPSPMVAIGCLEIVAAILIMAPTAIRYVYGIRQNGGQPIPLLQLILRDGMITFTLVSGLFLIIIIDMKEAGEAGRIIFPVAISVVSVANHQKSTQFPGGGNFTFGRISTHIYDLE
ncbi:hypothetical protein D9611_000062 [Ephemerocybe angulata]|uniref:Uncharacterized protein n=1 Tax=Ephemerocybe angulata TaxID=980116 RepID=A0A8H5BQ10_9AGAR|nr:hypothetical protein D9611_000062 [Tulosesus angulatus]